MSYIGDCYTPNKPGTNGYAQKVVWDKEAKKYRGTLLHRWVYIQHYGEVPEGYEIDHECHNQAVARGECKGGVKCAHRACINLDHLRAVPKSENQRSGLAGFGNRKTCESRRHELSADNIYTDSYGRQTCLACRRINSAASMRRHRQKAKVTA